DSGRLLAVGHAVVVGEGVRRALIDVGLEVLAGGLHRGLELRHPRGDRGVIPTVVALDRALDVPDLVEVRDGAVVDDRRGQVGAGGRERTREAAAHAPADRADRLRADVRAGLEIVDRGLKVWHVGRFV